MTINEHIKYCLDMAEYDYNVAKTMLDNKYKLYVGFMCHQTIEKAIKAYYVCKFDSKIPPMIHKLMRLATECDIYDNMEEEQQDLLTELDPLNVEARYPKDKARINEYLTDKKCKEIYERTGGLYTWIKQQLLILQDNMPKQ